MANSVYKVNKGINRPIEFKGLKAQYIWVLAIGIVGLLILFAILYLLGVHVFITLFLILLSGTLLFVWVYRFSKKYGQYGLMKKTARRQVPAGLFSNSRKLFIQLRKT
jgi:Flp pilus assembly protein TadB